MLSGFRYDECSGEYWKKFRGTQEDHRGIEVVIVPDVAAKAGAVAVGAELAFAAVAEQ